MSKYIDQIVSDGRSLEEVVPIDFKSCGELLDMLDQEIPHQKCPTGFDRLDDLIGGFEPGRLYVLSAPTKQGKTTLAQTFMFESAKQGSASLMFSYEMGWREVVRSFEKMNPELSRVLPMFLPMELDRSCGKLQYQWLFEGIAKAKQDSKIQLVVIDHLHFLIPLKDYKNMSLVVGGVVREIKNIAVALEIPIILIAHVRMIRDDKVPDWTMIRDSSMITQEADMVMMMYRIKSKEAAMKVTDESDIDPYTNKAMLSVELNRMGGKTGKIKLWHNGNMFEEFDQARHGIASDAQFVSNLQKKGEL